MRTLSDILAVDDATLKTYLVQEGRKLAEECYRLETRHETEMMDTPGQPEAWSVFLAILAASREVAGHLTEIVKNLDSMDSRAIPHCFRILLAFLVINSVNFQK